MEMDLLLIATRHRVDHMQHGANAIFRQFLHDVHEARRASGSLHPGASTRNVFFAAYLQLDSP